MNIYDTLSGTKREFTPANDPIRMYVCGVTPYDSCHIGHAMSYVFFDVIRRYLEYRGYKVHHAQNFTDIDDRLIDRSEREGVSTDDLAKGLIKEYFTDMDALNIQRAHVYPHATQEIPRIVEMIQGLVDQGYAYAVDANVYFRVQNFHRYGQLSGRTAGGTVSGARVEIDLKKEDPADFALWKSAKPNEPYWDSPWGAGRPGWHIECSAMALGYLGPSVDIHGGGQDLIFPHHENEIAQSEAYLQKEPFVRFWLHNGLLTLGEDKMSKSLGNLITIKKSLESYTPDGLRLFFLTSHYRSPLLYNNKKLAAGERAIERLRAAAYSNGAITVSEEKAEGFQERFIQAMDDDFNTPKALAILFELARTINRKRSQGHNPGGLQIVLRELGLVLGFTFAKPTTSSAQLPNSTTLLSLMNEIRDNLEHATRADDTAALLLETNENQPNSSLIESLVQARNHLRTIREFALADQIRSRLSELGIVLEDTSDGTLWNLRGLTPHP